MGGFIFVCEFNNQASRNPATKKAIPIRDSLSLVQVYSSLFLNISGLV
jgi:hypothetical protein